MQCQSHRTLAAISGFEWRGFPTAFFSHCLQDTRVARVVFQQRQTKRQRVLPSRMRNLVDKTFFEKRLVRMPH